MHIPIMPVDTAYEKTKTGVTTFSPPHYNTTASNLGPFIYLFIVLYKINCQAIGMNL